MQKVVMYATGWCGYCARARALLQRKNVPFEEIDVDAQPEARERHRLGAEPVRRGRDRGGERRGERRRARASLPAVRRADRQRQRGTVRAVQDERRGLQDEGTGAAAGERHAQLGADSQGKGQAAPQARVRAAAACRRGQPHFTEVGVAGGAEEDHDCGHEKAGSG